MFSGERCRQRAARYAKLSFELEDADARRAFRALAGIWRDLEPAARDLEREREARLRALFEAMAAALRAPAQAVEEDRQVA